VSLTRRDEIFGAAGSAVLLQRVCEEVTQAVPGVDAATITLLPGGEPYTPAGTGSPPVTRRCGELSSVLLCADVSDLV
jgi:hypothetical protein